MLYYKHDWAETRDWLAGWWHHEVRGHWALGVTAPREKTLGYHEVEETNNPRRKKTDFDQILSCAEKQSVEQWMGGITFPYVTA